MGVALLQEPQPGGCAERTGGAADSSGPGRHSGCLFAQLLTARKRIWHLEGSVLGTLGLSRCSAGLAVTERHRLLSPPWRVPGGRLFMPPQPGVGPPRCLRRIPVWSRPAPGAPSPASLQRRQRAPHASAHSVARAGVAWAGCPRRAWGQQGCARPVGRDPSLQLTVQSLQPPLVSHPAAHGAAGGPCGVWGCQAVEDP